MGAAALHSPTREGLFGSETSLAYVIFVNLEERGSGSANRPSRDPRNSATACKPCPMARPRIDRGRSGGSASDVCAGTRDAGCSHWRRPLGT